MGDEENNVQDGGDRIAHDVHTAQIQQLHENHHELKNEVKELRSEVKIGKDDSDKRLNKIELLMVKLGADWDITKKVVTGLFLLVMMFQTKAPDIFKDVVLILMGK